MYSATIIDLSRPNGAGEYHAIFAAIHHDANPVDRVVGIDIVRQVDADTRTRLGNHDPLSWAQRDTGRAVISRVRVPHKHNIAGDLVDDEGVTGLRTL